MHCQRLDCSRQQDEPRKTKAAQRVWPKHLAPGLVWIYDLPEYYDQHATQNPQAVIQAQLVHSLRASPYVASDPSKALFFLIPIPFDGNPGTRGRADSAAVLGYIRRTAPWFNRSLSHQPNHLLTFVGDHGIDLVVHRGKPRLREETRVHRVL